MDRQHLMKMAMLALAMVALVYIASLCSRKNKVENFENHDGHDDSAPESGNDDFQQDVDEEGLDAEDVGEPEHFTSGGAAQNQVQGIGSDGSSAGYESVENDQRNGRPADCFPKDQLTPGELLPGSANSKWSESVHSGQGELSDQNFLTAGYHVGVNTVGQTLRNANRQIRSEPPNPQVKVSPWLQTTIETDSNRRPLEIGGCQ